MIALNTDFLFAALVGLLAKAIGPERALTLDELTAAAGIPHRRMTEQIIEERLADFPFAVVAGAHGYHRPMKAQELNQYVHSLHTRHQRMKQREDAVILLALKEGFTLEGDRFVDPAQRQPEMPFMDPRKLAPGDAE